MEGGAVAMGKRGVPGVDGGAEQHWAQMVGSKSGDRPDALPSTSGSHVWEGLALDPFGRPLCPLDPGLPSAPP